METGSGPGNDGSAPEAEHGEPATTSGSGTPSAAPSTAREVALTSALLFAMMVSTFPEFALGVLAPFLVEELAVGEASIGIAASLLYLGAAVVARTAGRRLDVMSGRTGFLILYGTSVAALALLAASRSLVWLLALGLVASGGLGLNNPLTSRLIVEGIRPRRRGIAIGVKQTGVKIGQTVAGALLPWLALSLGWRPGLLLLCGVALLLLAVSLPAVPARGQRTPSSSRPDSAAARREVRWLQYYSLAMATGQSALTIYLALYAVQQVGTSVTQGGLLVAAFALIATATRLFWVIAAERLMRPDRALLLLSGGAVVGLLLIVGADGGGTRLLWAGAVVTGATVGTWNVVVQYAILTEVPPEHTAAATGAVQAAFMLGLCIGAPLFGVTVEMAGSFMLAWAIAIALALGAAAVTVRRRPRATPR